MFAGNRLLRLNHPFINRQICVGQVACLFFTANTLGQTLPNGFLRGLNVAGCYRRAAAFSQIGNIFAARFEIIRSVKDDALTQTETLFNDCVTDFIHQHHLFGGISGLVAHFGADGVGANDDVRQRVD